MDGRHLLQVFVHGAHQHLTPEAFNGARCLACFEQPLHHADAVQILAPGSLAPDCEQRARDSEFVLPFQALHAQERLGEVQRRGQASAAKYGDAAARLDEIELAMELNALAYAQPLVEIQQIHAAPQQHVLAVIDGLGDLFPAGRNRVRGGAAPQKRARLEKRHFPALFPQSRRRG